MSYPANSAVNLRTTRACIFTGVSSLQMEETALMWKTHFSCHGIIVFSFSFLFVINECEHCPAKIQLNYSCLFVWLFCVCVRYFTTILTSKDSAFFEILYKFEEFLRHRWDKAVNDHLSAVLSITTQVANEVKRWKLPVCFECFRLDSALQVTGALMKGALSGITSTYNCNTYIFTGVNSLQMKTDTYATGTFPRSRFNCLCD